MGWSFLQFFLSCGFVQYGQWWWKQRRGTGCCDWVAFEKKSHPKFQWFVCLSNLLRKDVPEQYLTLFFWTRQFQWWCSVHFYCEMHKTQTLISSSSSRSRRPDQTNFGQRQNWQYCTRFVQYVGPVLSLFLYRWKMSTAAVACCMLRCCAWCDERKRCPILILINTVIL